MVAFRRPYGDVKQLRGPMVGSGYLRRQAVDAKRFSNFAHAPIKTRIASSAQGGRAVISLSPSVVG